VHATMPAKLKYEQIRDVTAGLEKEKAKRRREEAAHKDEKKAKYIKELVHLVEKGNAVSIKAGGISRLITRPTLNLIHLLRASA